MYYTSYQNINIGTTMGPAGVSTYELYYNKMAATATFKSV